MASIAIVLKTTQKLKNGEFPVVLRVTHERQSRYIALSMLVINQSLKWRCKVIDWKPATIEDNGLGKFRKSFKTYKECNMVLEMKLSEANKLLQKYDKEATPFSFNRFETDLKRKENAKIISIDEYYTTCIKLLEEQKRIGLAGLYKENQSILRKFRPKTLLSDVNFRFLESFEYWMRNERGNKDTTISVKMRNLQRVINQAIDDDFIKKGDYPFGEKKYSINKRLDHTTKKLAISLDKLGKLKALKLKPGTALHFAQQVFLFSYYSRGINFIDIAYLTWNDISDTHISYIRKKTRGMFEIPINMHNKKILSYFKENCVTQDNFVFPIINPTIHKSLKQQYTRKKTALKAVNDNLKKIAKIINEPNLKLTTNVGRHTYATGLKRNGVATGLIKEALGHSTEQQTQTYLDEFEKGMISNFEKIIYDI